MKKLVSFLFVLSFLYSCSDVEGNLVGVSGRDTWYPDVLGPGKMPLGMVYIPSGAFQSGEDGEDIMGMHTARKKTVSVPAFYMDATEISNNEYRQFVHWVRDSIAREKLYARSIEDADRWINQPDNFFREPYRTMIDMGSDVQGGNTPFQLFMDSANNANVDKTFLLLTGAKPNKFLKSNKLINGYQYKAPKTGNATKEKISVVMTDEDLVTMFSSFSAPKKKDGSFEKAIPDVEGSVKKDGTNQGGRTENRKYFTLNWEEPIEYDDPDVAFLLSDMYYSAEESFYKRKEIDTRLLFFDYFWIDYKEAARRGKVVTKAIDSRVNFDYEGQTPANRREPLGKDAKTNDLHRSTLFYDGQKTWVDETTTNALERDENGGVVKIDVDPDGNQLNYEGSSLNSTDSVRSTILENPGQDLDLGFTNSKGQHNAIRGHTDRSRFIIQERIYVYPDTLCWVRDYTYAFHHPMTQNYFWNTAYDNYPVVGVTWSQAKAFSVWRTQIFHSWLQSNGDLFVNDFRLPTESEWERAARGDLDMSEYPWGGPYIRNNSGCFLANFKPMRGRYFEDGGFYTVKVYSYNPNGFGLYCMAGNVAEWCSSAFDESAYDFETDMAPDYEYDAKDGDPTAKKRKVLRGGSWKDIGFYLMNSTRTFEYQDTAKSYIGFRNTMTHVGRGGKSIEQENGEEIQSDISIK